MELLNWGTFNGAIHRILPDARWSLLIGDNGSGKSTTADALRTLLVPPSKSSYNDASIDHKLRKAKSDRTRLSYIRGAFGAVSQEDSAVPIVQHHRDEGTLSILLAVFINEVRQANVTLAQILWSQNNKADQIYLVAREDKNIKDHLTGLSMGKNMRKELQLRGFEPFPSFSAYEETFRRYLGIPGAGALEVFNQVIGVKEVNDLNQFIRKHMLEPTDTHQYIETHIKPHYVQLNACWEAIQRAEEQLQILNPIAERYVKWEEAKTNHAGLDRLRDVLAHYYDQRQLEMRFAYDEELEAKITKLKEEQTRLLNEQSSQQTKRDSLNAAISNDATGQRLKDIARELESATAERDHRLRAQQSLRQQMTILQRTFPLENSAQFDAMRQKLLTDKGPLEGNYEAHERKKMEAYAAKDSAEKARKQLGEEAQAIRDSGALIPKRLQDVRQKVCQATGVPEKDLPFAGELIEVEPEFKDWTGAIERLLHGFGISMLVSERHYRQVASFINANFLGTRLEFHQVPNMFSPSRPDILNDRNRVPARLRFQEESPFCKWLQAEVVRRFSHPCCETVDQLREQNFGITKNGMIKDGARHVKDDRFDISDRKQYVLGWSTQSKLAALMEEFELLTQQVNDNDRKFKQSVEQLKGINEKLSAIKLILAIENFDEIDPRPFQERMISLHDEQERLKKASDKVRELQRQLDAVDGELTQLAQKLEKKNQEIGSLGGKREDNTRRVNQLKQELEGVPQVAEEFQTQIIELQGDNKLTLDTFGSVQNAVDRKIQEKLRTLQGQMDAFQGYILPAMQKFLQQYPQERASLMAEIAYGSEFIKLRDEIKGEELPKHHERFFSLLNTKLIMDMAAFNMKLVQDEKDIRDRIGVVNQTLRHTKFSRETYVHIRVTPANSDEIRTFRARLKSCLTRGILPEPSEQDAIYKNIRELIADFEKQPEWTARVTDVRNWMDYGVQELDTADNTEVEYYAVSSGKSGGEKTLLAFTIMASAITSQYGLTGNGDDLNRFRLVLVDEAFAKTDPDNSRRALELFQALDLQLIVINPWDAKSRIVENYVDSYHLANTNLSTHCSSLTRATRERYLEVRKAWEAKNAQKVDAEPN